jgi:hypothetical protein
MEGARMTNVSIQRFALPILLVFLVGCSGRSGVISGELVAVGGPANVRMRLPGIVRISGGGGHLTYRIAAAADGSFSAEVPAGAYVVTGRSPLYQGEGGIAASPSPPSWFTRTKRSLSMCLAT